jgi:hypothetical protein
MPDSHPLRILVLTDTSEADPNLLAAIERRVAVADVVFRLVVLNPARAEVHLLHPERRDKAAQAEKVLRQTMPRLEAAAGGHRIVGSVSVRHDPIDAVEETLASEPVDEVMVHVRESAMAARLHHDVVHRLARYGLPVEVVEHEAAR